MSYNNRYSGAITIRPPLDATAIRQAPATQDARLRISEETRLTPEGEVVIRTAGVIEPACDGFSGYNLTDDIQRLVDHAGPGRTYGGYIEVRWDAGFGEQVPQRYVIRDGRVEIITPRLTWEE